MPYTRAEKLAAIDRELKMRHRVYPRLVARGQMLQADANHEWAIMVEIRSDYAENDLFAQADLVAESIGQERQAR